jgi:hypothetical protein
LLRHGANRSIDWFERTVPFAVNDGNTGQNYMVALLADHTGIITRRALSVGGVTANNKPFDGNTNATLDFGAAALVGVIAPGLVTLDPAGATGTSRHRPWARGP